MKWIKRFNEGVDDLDEIVSTIKDILSELDFLDISYQCVTRSSGSIYDSNKIIRIIIQKPIVGDFRSYKDTDTKKSFEFSDIEEVLATIKSYLEDLGYFPFEEYPLINKGIWNGILYQNMRTQYCVKYKLR